MFVLLRFLSSPSGQRAWLFLLPSIPVGVTGFEPVTLRLSSACSNQLSYTPGKNGRSARWMVQCLKSTSFWEPETMLHGGGKGTRTPDL